MIRSKNQFLKTDRSTMMENQFLIRITLDLNAARNIGKFIRFNFYCLSLAFLSPQIVSYHSHSREDSIRSVLIASVNPAYGCKECCMGLGMHTTTLILFVSCTQSVAVQFSAAKL